MGGSLAVVLCLCRSTETIHQFLANQKPVESEPPAKRLDGHVGIPAVNVVNVNAPGAGGHLNFANLANLANPAIPMAEYYLPNFDRNADANANREDPKLEHIPDSPISRPLLETTPALPANRELDFFPPTPGAQSRESTLPPTVILSEPDPPTPPVPAPIPSYALTMPFDLYFNVIEDNQKLALYCGETLEEIMLDIYRRNGQNSLLRTYIDWGLIYLSDHAITEHLKSAAIKELRARTRKTAETGVEWARIVERYRDTSSIIKGNQCTPSLETWYVNSVANFKDYPANILCQGDWWRHERYWSFLDSLFALSKRINRRRTPLQQAPSKREPTQCNIYEYFDHDYGLQLAYLEHQLHSKTSEHIDLFYLSKVLLGTYRDWLSDHLAEELTVFAIICNGPRINIYRFAPVTNHFVVVTSYHALISHETLPKVLEMLYKVKISMDRSIQIFDKHFAADDPF